MSEASGRFYRCPCCTAHTLNEPAPDESCALCKWQPAGANAGYEIREARENVQLYGVMFRPSDERFARVRHPILGPAGETAIDRVALRQRMYAEFANFAEGRPEPVALSERLIALLTIIRNADTLYVRKS